MAPRDPPLKVLHLSAGNRWTGAAAPAFAEVEALRAVGVDAHYAYVGGYKLEAKIGALPFTHPLIERKQNPASFLRSVRALGALIDRLGIDVVHAHLTYDHWLARAATRGRAVRLARTFHARRVMRADPFTKSLVASTAHLFTINAAFAGAPLFAGRAVTFTPPPLDRRLFHPQGPNARADYSIDRQTPLLAAIGKLAPGRGFEEALATFAAVRRGEPAATLMIIGHGPHRPELERVASALDVAGSVIWAGYHEDDLAEHFRAADALLFTAKGSDEGHRAVLEAMACGTQAVSLPIEGMEALLDRRFLAGSMNPETLAAPALAVLAARGASRRAAASESVARFEFAPAAERLISAYS